MSDLISPQPDPIKNDLPASWDLVADDFRAAFGDEKGPVIAVLVDMRERDRFGHDKYGVRIQPQNGRDNLVDAYQELLDGAVYFRSALYETETPELRAMYDRTLALIFELRAAIWGRDGA
jgi:hypothetical protein